MHAGWILFSRQASQYSFCTCETEQMAQTKNSTANFERQVRANLYVPLFNEPDPTLSR